METKSVQSSADSTSGSLKFECGICLKEFSTPWCLQIHIKTHTEEGYSCDECGMTFPGFQELFNHLNLHILGPEPQEDVETSGVCENNGPVPMIDVDKTSKSGLTCKKCGKSFGSDKVLKLHLRQHDKKKPHKCQVCGLKFASRNRLKIHWKSSSDHQSVPAYRTEKISQKRVMHERLNPAYLKFVSRKCKSAKDKSSEVELKGRDKHRCRVCKAALPQDMKLRRAHVRKHLLVKLNKSFYHAWKYLKAPLKTVNCRDSYESPWTGTENEPGISNKIRTVDGFNSVIVSRDSKDKSQKTPQDGKTSKRNSNMIKTNKRPRWYRCEVCSEKLKRKKDLKEHFRIEHPESKRFTNLRTVSGESTNKKMSPWFTCGTCGNKIRGKKKFDEHLQLAHIGKPPAKNMLDKVQRCADTVEDEKRRLLTSGPGKHLTSNQSLSLGTKHGSTGPWFQCSTCGKILKGKTLLQDHCQELHSVFGSSDTATPGTSSDGPYSTTVGQKVTSEGNGKQFKHQWRKCCKKVTCAWYICNACDEKLKGKSRINNHVLTCCPGAGCSPTDVHPSQPLHPWRSTTASPHCSWLTCGLCDKKFQGKKRMSEHSDICKGAETPTVNRTSSVETNENFCSVTISSDKESSKSYPSLSAVTSISGNSDLTDSYIDSGTKLPDVVKCKSGPWYKCLLCSKHLKGRDQAKMHNHNEQSLMVGNSECHKLTEKTFKSSSGILFFKNASWYQCQVCNKSISGRLTAENHSHDTPVRNDVDSVEKPETDTDTSDSDFVQRGTWYRCTLCGKLLRGRRNMKLHGPCREPVEICVKALTKDSRSIGKLTEGPVTELTQSPITELTEDLITEVPEGSIVGNEPETLYVGSTTRQKKKSETPKNIDDTKNSQALSADSNIDENFIRSGCWYRCTVCKENLQGIKRLEGHCHYQKPTNEPCVVETKDSAESEGTLMKALKAFSKAPPYSAQDVGCEGNPIKQYMKCKLCGKLFASKSNLCAHMKKHPPPPRRFECSACRKRFINKSGLKLHQRNMGHQSRKIPGSRSSIDNNEENVELFHDVPDNDKVSCPMMPIRAGCHKEQVLQTKTMSWTAGIEQDCQDLHLEHAEPNVKSKHVGPSPSEDEWFVICDKIPSDYDDLDTKETNSIIDQEDGMSRKGNVWSVFVEFDGCPQENFDDLPALDFYGDYDGKVDGSSGMKGCEKSAAKGLDTSDSCRNSHVVFDSTDKPHFLNKRKGSFGTKCINDFSLDKVGLCSGDKMTSPVSEAISNNPRSQRSLEDMPSGSDCTGIELSVSDHYFEQGTTFVCKFCSKQCSHSSSIIRHVKSHLMKPRFRCQTCGFMYSNYSNLKKHELNKHTVSPTTAKTVSQTVKKYMSIDGKACRCDICSKTFARKTHLRQHIHGHLMKQAATEKHSSCQVKETSDKTHSIPATKTHTSDDRLPLSNTVSQILSPQTSVSDDSQRNEVEDDQISDDVSNDKQTGQVSNFRQPSVNCELSSRFPSHNTLFRPEVHDSALHPHASPSCQQWVCLPQQIEDQQCLIKGEFACQLCFKRFATQLTAREHVASHFRQNSTTCWRACEYSKDCLQMLNLDPECRVCGAVFADNATLFEHEERHTEAERLEVLKYLKCSHCGHLCRTHALMQKHQSVHKYMQLKCSQCSTFFTDIVHLDLHVLMKRHFMCQCGQVFPGQSSLDTHRRHCCFIAGRCIEI